MQISSLKINNLRNIEEMALTPCPRFNVFYGENASGKTSILEAIYLLGLGRSFRSHKMDSLIRHQESGFILFTELQTSERNIVPIGIERLMRRSLKLKISGEVVRSVAELAKTMPLQFVDQLSYRVVDEGPKFRRQFLDWGLFHVEPLFFPLWKNTQRILLQRNAALKSATASSGEIKLWDSDFAAKAVEMSTLRARYFEGFCCNCLKIMDLFLPNLTFEFDYYQGWPSEQSLLEVLSASYNSDKRFGYTRYGPQRADIIIKVDGRDAQEVLSRGQKKLLVTAMSLAQGVFLQESYQQQSLYLIDDLTAELDGSKCEIMLKILSDLQAQVFVTVVNKGNLMSGIPETEKAMFHVKHGRIVG